MSLSRGPIQSNLRQSQHNKKPPFECINKSNQQQQPPPLPSLPPPTQSITEQIIINLSTKQQQSQNNSILSNNNNTVLIEDDAQYNVPWDSKKFKQQQQTVNNNNNNEPSPIVSQEHYCAPWDLKMQQELIKHQLSTSTTTTNTSTTTTTVTSNTTTPTIDNSCEYNKPWDHQSKQIQIVTNNTPLLKHKISTTSIQQQQQPAPTPTPTTLNDNNNEHKFHSWGSNSSTSSFDLTSPSSDQQRKPVQLPPLSQLPPPLPSIPAYMVVLERQSWYHGKITRKQAEQLLFDKQIGSYLVRQSESGNTNDFSLSLVSASGCVHMRICLKNGEFILGQCSQPFTSIIKMIEHYSKVEVPIKGAQHVKLTKPIIVI